MARRVAWDWGIGDFLRQVLYGWPLLDPMRIFASD